MLFPVFILEVSQDSPSSFGAFLSCSQKWNGACVTIFKNLLSLLRRVLSRSQCPAKSAMLTSMSTLFSSGGGCSNFK